MGFLDNLFNKSDCSQFGITEAQVKELDMLDGKEDNKINGKSIFEAVRDAKDAYDAQSTNKDDSFWKYLKTTYKKTVVQVQLQDTNLIKIKAFSLNNCKPEEVVDDLINEIYKFGRADLDRPINKITSKNVVEVLRMYKTKSDEKNTILGKKLDDETLFEAILDESISGEEKKKYITHIKDKLVERINGMNGNAEFISNTFDKVFDEVLQSPWGLQDSTKLDQLFDTFLKIISELYGLNKMNDVRKDARLEVSLQGIYDFCRNNGIDTADLFGNGKLDGNAYQMTGNCILHADINAMLVSDKGRQYLNNLLVKDNSPTGDGNITVYLPGAVKLGVPQNRPGYFTYSVKELMNRALSTSIGDGDYTALVCAIEDCRKLATGDTNANSVGSSTDIPVERILFEQKPYSFMYEDVSRIKNFIKEAKDVLDSSPLASKSQRQELEKQIEDAVSVLKYSGGYDEIKKLFDSGSYAITAGIFKGEVIRGTRNGQKFTLYDNHMYAVVAMSDSTVTLRESNNPESLITVTKEEYMKMTSRILEIFINNNIPSTNDSLRK